jgi:serine/threonine protein kinase
MAPETLNNLYSKKSDAWSIGVVIYMLLTGKLPFDGQDNTDLFNNIKNGKYNKHIIKEAEISIEAKDLIKGLLKINEDSRLGVDDILNSTWIKRFEMSEELNTKIIMKFFENNNIMENFRKFERYSYFKKEVLFSIAKLSQDDEVRQLKKIFMEFDKDSSGSIDKNEVKSIFIKLGISTNDV